jgi:hypothetical protein
MALTRMVRTRVSLPREELDALRLIAAQTGTSVAELVRGAIHKVLLDPRVSGPVALWDGKLRLTSIQHDV